ncbi:MAG: hypothetical protein OJF50_000951 [Nitrospira sp.]|jgi:hypothetical protein|nr:hypothetical protein [Nitrospira sp.]
MSGDDDLILEDLVRIDPGQYEAIVVSTKKVRRFGNVTIEFLFRIVSPGSAFDVQLRGYCNLGPTDGRRIKQQSKLAKWMRLIAAFAGISQSRVRLRHFRDYWLSVRVDTVTKDYRQQPLAPHDQYSSVINIVAVIGNLADRREEQKQVSARDMDAS